MDTFLLFKQTLPLGGLLYYRHLLTIPSKLYLQEDSCTTDSFLLYCTGQEDSFTTDSFLFFRQTIRGVHHNGLLLIVQANYRRTPLQRTPYYCTCTGKLQEDSCRADSFLLFRQNWRTPPHNGLLLTYCSGKPEGLLHNGLPLIVRVNPEDSSTTDSFLLFV